MKITIYPLIQIWYMGLKYNKVIDSDGEKLTSDNKTITPESYVRLLGYIRKTIEEERNVLFVEEPKKVGIAKLKWWKK